MAQPEIKEKNIQARIKVRFCMMNRPLGKGPQIQKKTLRVGPLLPALLMGLGSSDSGVFLWPERSKEKYALNGFGTILITFQLPPSLAGC